MTQETRKKVYLIYGAVLSVLILVIAVMLILACIRIYESGDSPFSRESIAGELAALRLPAFFLLDMLLAGILLSITLPLDEVRPRAIRESGVTLAKLVDRAGRSGAPEERKKRTALRIASAALTVLLFVYPSIYLANAKNFGLEELTANVKHAAILVLLAAAIAFAVSAASMILTEKSFLREIEATKRLLAMQAESPVEPVREEPRVTLPSRISLFMKKHEKPIVLSVRIVLALTAVAFIVLGVLNGGINDVLAKAARICTECIGLG